ncbi:MAG: hypothetical protein H5T45_00375 [Thermoplasmatales archaeon]|nr:hypothetical protein [Thermoplasmatales archaeon]
MNYLLLLLTALLAFTWGMLFAFWLIFARTASKLSYLIEEISKGELKLEEVYQLIKNVIDKAYEEIKKGKNENL